MMAAMLIISRAPGESLLIGKSELVVRGVEPRVQLALTESGQVTEFDFRPHEVAGTPSVRLEAGRVFIQRIERGRVVLAIDLPRDVRVLKGELAGGAAG